MHELADAIRLVTAKVQREIDQGRRSRSIDADDLVEVLLAIADQLDPFFPESESKKPQRRGRH
ncbi:MAG: hypothetical protein SGJ19_06320 [Planctomycetia bacterium]|nr:hypothetical protein [Planctomycetia bacterium]